MRIRKAFANVSLANVKILETHLSKVLQLGRCIPIVFNRLFRAALGLAAKFWKSMNLSLGKNISKPLLDADYNFIINKTNTDPLSLLKGSEITITDNKIKDIVEVTGRVSQDSGSTSKNWITIAEKCNYAIS